MKRIVAAGLLAACSITGLAALHAQTTTGADGLIHYGSYGIDLAGGDRSVAPGDDFYATVNGTWARTTAIPADKASYGAFDTLADLSRDRTHGILEAQKRQGTRIGTAYAAYLDTAAIEAKGLAPVRPWLDRIKGLKDKAGYAALAAEADDDGLPTPFSTNVGQDAKQSEVYAVGLRQAGLGLPDRDYYLKADDAKLAAAKAAYQAHIAKMFTLAGEADAEARAAAVVAFETQIAGVSWTRTESRDANKVYNKTAVAQLAQSAPGFDFAAFLKGIGTPVDTVIVGQPSAIAGIARLIGAAPLQVLKDQMLIRSLDGYADVLPAAFDRERFAFYGTVLGGTPQQEERWKRAVDWTSGAISDDVSRLYVAQYFPPETKQAADALVKNVIAAMNRRIDGLAWMAPETKVKAHAKLAAFVPKIGYPDRWRDYSNLQIVAGDAFGNKRRARRWAHDYNVGHLGKPLQRWEWGMTPMTVNAYANFGMVEIVFPAAILQPPFFDPKADPAVNYGGIGSVIGHEMSHHFDDQGAKFDAHGQLIQWWTDEDVKRFNALEDRLAAQYDAYEPLPGRHLNGRLTLGENSADLAGLNASLDAYHASLGGKKAPVIAGTTGDQRFYMGFAQVWRRKHREDDLRQRLLTDPHSPAEQRVATVRNLDAWYAAFQPKPGQKLYLAPDARVRIW